MHRLARFQPKPGAQLLGSARNQPALLDDGRSLRPSALYDGNRFTQEFGNLLPAFQCFRLDRLFFPSLGSFGHRSLRCHVVGASGNHSILCYSPMSYLKSDDNFPP